MAPEVVPGLRRVVIVNDFGAVNGGAAQVAIASALELARRGLQVDFLCAVGPVDARLAAAGVAVTCLDQHDILNDPYRLRAAVRGIWNLSSARALERLLTAADPASTIVHVHGWTKALSASVFRVTQRLGLHVVVTLHEYFTACPEGGFFDHGAGTICERRAMGAACLAANCDSRSRAQKLWRVARQGVATVFTDVHGGLPDVIYLSDLSRSLLAPYFGPSTRWHFVPNPIDVERGLRSDAENQNEFVFVGRLSVEKGCALFCEAVSVAGVEAVVIGDGPEMAALRRRWPRVRMTGWLDSAGVRSHLRRARALVLPSLCYETQGLVVHEALSCGVPVIVADRTAARDAVLPGTNGLLFQQASAASLVQAIGTLQSDDVVRQMSENAYEGFWFAPPTLRAHGDSLLTAYADVLAVVR